MSPVRTALHRHESWGARLLVVIVLTSTGPALAQETVPQETPADAKPQGPDTAQVTTEETESFLLDYRAPEACPGRTRFEELTQALTPAARFQAVGSTSSEEQEKAPRRLAITISQRTRDYFGTLEIVDEQTRARRQFDAETCDEIVEALALATALAIDPDALGGDQTSASESEQSEQKDASQTAPSSPKDAALGARTSPTLIAQPRVHLTLGIRGSATWLHMSERAGDAEAQLQPSSVPAWEAAPVLEMEVRLGKVWTSMNISVGYGAAHPADVDLTWLPQARLGLCPIWWSPVGAFRMGLCGGVSAARLVALPSEAIMLGARASSTWGSIDGTIRAELGLGRLRLGVGASLVAPLREIPYILASRDGNDEALLTIHRRAAPRVLLSATWALF